MHSSGFWTQRQETPLPPRYRPVIATVFLALVVVQSLRVRDRDTMFAACATLALGYALIAAPRYWPWYVTMPAALLSLRPTPRNRTLVYVITVCAMLVAPLDTCA